MKTNYQLRYASNPRDAKNYDTTRLREEFLIPVLIVKNEVNLIYSIYDRMIIGGAMPVAEELTLERVDPLESDYFLQRREVGVFNVSRGTGVINVDGVKYQLEYKEALYIGMGVKNVTFMSVDASNPAKFYFNSTPAHISFPTRKITKAEAITSEPGSEEMANHRIIKKMIVPEILQTCQLQMGMTELQSGSVWSDMPPHAHNRRMESFFCFEVPEGQAVCHFIGEPAETRHLWMQGNQAVWLPEWSVHTVVATTNYTFIWGMGGEDLDYGDQNFYKYTDLR
ncbi:MAG: 5-dehydro-4-deoxy-D-glucuronate isomerase [Bacteroidales bacterium]